MKSKRFFYITVLTLGVAFFFILSPCIFPFAFNVDPPRIALTISPGTSRTGYVVISNYGSDRPIHVRVYVNDLIFLPDGTNDFLPPGATPWSCAAFIKIRPTEFEVGPNRDEIVRYEAQLPADAKGGYYGVLLFEAAEGGIRAPSQSTVGIRIGSILLLTAANTAEYKARLASLSLFPKDGGKSGFLAEYVVYNEGNILCRPQGKLLLTNPQGKVIAELKLNRARGGIFPGTSRTYTDIYKDPIPKDRYTAKIILDYGGKSLIGGQKEFVVE